MRNAEHLLYRQASEAQRREKWLSQQVGDPEHRQEAVPASTADRYGLDLEEFKGKTGRSSILVVLMCFVTCRSAMSFWLGCRPKDWNKCVQIAGWVCIDEMRKLLERRLNNRYSALLHIHVQTYV